nr:MAG TPA: hypothetical protein [Caudoviricetes sp.]
MFINSRNALTGVHRGNVRLGADDGRTRRSKKRGNF